MLSEKTKESFNEIYTEALEVYRDENKLKNWLRFQLNLTEYSPLNRMFLYSQNPDAAYVASYTKWKKLGHPVTQKGCLYVLSPQIIKGFYTEDHRWKPIRQASDAEKEQINNGFLKKNDFIRDYRFVPVFDISKTDAKIEDLVMEMTEKRNKERNVGEIYNCLSAYLEKNSNGSTFEAKIYDLVSDYVSKEVYRNESFDIASDTLNGETLRELAKETISYCILNRFNIDNSLFKFNSLSKIQWNQDEIEDLMKMNKYICSTSEMMINQLSEAFI